MAASRNGLLRVGVIGLGKLWESRHKPALARMADRFRVTAVYDQVARRAAVEAAGLGCVACDGLRALIERDDVDVVYLLTPQWFGLHPISIACEHRKPVYCGTPLASEPDRLDELAGEIRSSGTPFTPELARRFYPATLRVRELLATSLGPPRLIVGHGRLFDYDRYGQPGPSTQNAPLPLLIDPGSNLLDWCRFLFQAEPTSIQGIGGAVLPAATGGSSDFETFLAHFDGGKLAQITISRYHRDPWGDATQFLPPPGFQVFAERGAAWLEMPDRIQWTDSQGGPYEERLPIEPSIGELLNAQFLRMVRGERSMAPTLDDALTVARLVADLHRGRSERAGLASPVDEETE